MKISLFLAALAFLFQSVPAQSQAPGTAQCARLMQLSLPAAKVTRATLVAAGSFAPEGKLDPQQAAMYQDVPAFCRVSIHAAPSADSDIAIEIWLPAAGWNGKFRGVGNGGFAGALEYGQLATAVRQGYATASTDTGHNGGEQPATNSVWALGHPEKIADFGYRAVHLMTMDAKTAIHSFYGKAPAHSYFASCSNGGRQGLMEAERFPADYEGILAGAPAYNWVPLVSNGLQALQKFEGAGYIPSEKVPAIAAAVIAQCDALDGVKDGLINDPPECHVDTSAMLCKGADSDACLTAPQIVSLKTIYAGAHDANGKLLLPGYSPGGEDGPGGWKAWITGDAPGRSVGAAFTNGFFRNLVYENPQWNYRTADFESAYSAADRKLASVLNATDTDLRPFAAHGGKLILYHGWSDPAIPAGSTIEYYNQVSATVGAQQTTAFVRLYMAPGMQHCGGGPGPDDFGELGGSSRTDPDHDIYTALEQWVEGGKAPNTIIATKHADDDPEKPVKMTRPLCPYPEVARYKGEGDTNIASSFACAAP